MEEKKRVESGKTGLIVLVSISLLVMIVAVAMIYVYTRQFKPEALHVNDQAATVSDNAGFVNPDSPQQLERDASNIDVKPLENSRIFIIGGGVFMVVMAASFLFAKFVERKDDN